MMFLNKKNEKKKHFNFPDLCPFITLTYKLKYYN